MYAIRYTLLVCLFSILGLSQVDAQLIWGVDYYVEYNPETCNFDAHIIIDEGFATGFQERTQFNAQYTIVVPSNVFVTYDTAYAPLLDNVLEDSDEPMDWIISSTKLAPAAAPDKNFFAFAPSLGGGLPPAFNSLAEGDTVKLFGFQVDPIYDCGIFVRPFDPDLDPNSDTMDDGLDFNNGYTIGRATEQLFRDYVKDVPGPKPVVTFDIKCDGGVTLVAEPVDSLVCIDQEPFMYEWTGPNGFFSTDPVPSVPSGNGSGEYCVSIIDAFGCDTMICQMLVVNDPEIISETVCGTDDPYTLTHSGPGTGTWQFDDASNTSGASIGTTSGGSADVTFTSAATGEYVFVYVGEGCESETTITVMPASSEPNVTNDGPKCDGEITTLTADFVAGATYEWSGDATGSDRILEVASAGTYTLTMSVDGCPSSVDVIVSYNPSPSTPTLDVNTPVCVGETVNFTATTIAGVADADYVWTLNGGEVFTTQNPSIPAAALSNSGTYELVVTLNGCPSIVATIDLTVNDKASTPSIDAVADLCVGDDLNLNTSAVANTYTWTHTASGTQYAGQSPLISPITLSDAGEYTLVVNDGACDSDPASIIITINDKPNAPVIDPVLAVCVGEQIDFNASNISGVAYTWTHDGTNNNQFSIEDPSIPSATLGDAGTYTLVVTENGCSSDPATVTVTVNDTAPAPNASIDGPKCEGENVEFSTDFVSGATYTWTNSSSSASPIVTTDAIFDINSVTSDYAGTWSLEVNLNGCVSQATTVDLIINQNPTTPNPTSNSEICENETLELYANATADGYEWRNPDGFFFTSDQNPTIPVATIADDEGTYTLILISADGCRSESGSVDVVINPIPLAPNTSSNSPICENEDIQLNTDAVADSYTWTGPTGIVFNEANPTISGSSAIAGEYKLVVRVDGCDSPESSEFISILPSPLAPVLGSNGPLCTGMDLMLTADISGSNISGSATIEYIWTGPNSFTSDQQNPTITSVGIEADGDYNLIVEADGCPSSMVSINVDVYQSPNQPTIDPISPVCVGEEVTLIANASEAGVSYTWTLPNGTMVNSQSATITDVDATDAGTATVVTSINGCDSQPATIEIVVANPPTPDAGSYSTLCEDADPIVLGGTPSAGGVFTGDGVSGNEFDPTGLSGDITITYTVTDINSCVGTATTIITVNEVPVPDAGTYSSVCEDADDVLLVGIPSTGTFSGDGVTGNTFDPSGQSGDVEITYEVIDANGCSAIATTIITVNDVPVPDAGTYSSVCEDADDVLLVGTPSTGTFSGDGVTGNTFDPSGQSGDVEITYEVIDANGCSAIATTIITVNEVPVPDAGTYSSVCEDADDVLLVGTPSTGTFSGDGVTGNTFDPSGQSGDVEITYEVIDANGCSAIATTIITVNDVPVPDAGTYSSVCEDADDVLLVGTPSTGTFSGAGVTGNTFDPSGQSGDVEITYEVIDANGCSAIATTIITVNDVPTPDAGTYSSVCEDADDVLLVGTPTTGTFSGDGVTGNTFDPSGLSGDVEITYEVIDMNGCSAIATTIITVNDVPTADAGTYSSVCFESDPITLVGTPNTGAFSGDFGVVGNTFDPSGLGAGNYDIMYTVTSAEGCSTIATTSITILEETNGDAGSYSEVCIDGNEITLAGSPGGGSFSSTSSGVSGNTFSPSAAGVGTHTITYEFTDANGCEGMASTTIEVRDLPTVSLDSYQPVCADADPFILIGTPGGGTFTGSGVNDGFFEPSSVGDGLYTITYTWSDDLGCENSATTEIEVFALPIIDAGTYADVCIDADPFTLTGSHTGGTWNGNGVSSDVFDPSIAGVGIHIITYDFIDGNGCGGSATTEITVVDLPTADAGNYNSMCIEDAPIALIGNSQNGVFTGTGVTSDGLFFDPFLSGAGDFTVTYTVTENGCTNVDIITIEVNNLPNVDANSWGPYCIYDNEETLIGSPQEGTFSGQGVSANIFNPESAGAGVHTITYVYTDDEGCSNSATTEITVFAKPIVQAGIYPDVCMGSEAFEIVGNPSSGTFSGTGVSPDGTMFDPELSGPGTFTIDYIYQDANGCSDIATAEVTVLERPTTPVPTSNSEICEDATLELMVDDVTDGVFMWTGPNGYTSTAQNPIITNADPDQHSGTYQVKVTVDGCESELGSVEVVVNATPDTPVPTSNGPICEGETLIVSVDEVPGAMYDWSGPNGLVSTERVINIPNANQDQVGAYCLIITVNGCESDFECVDVIINEKPEAPEITTTAPVCIGTDISFSTEVVADSYLWTYPDDSEFSTDQNPVLTGSDMSHNGTFTLVVTIDGCVSDGGTVFVEVNDLPSVSAGPFEDMCTNDDPITLTGTPENGAFSGPGVDGNIFDPSTAGPGTHELTYEFSDANSCTASTMVEITVNDIPTLELISVDCSADLNTYTVTFNSNGIVTSGTNSVTGNQVTNIPITEDAVLKATLAGSSCEVILPVSKPQCDCDDVNGAVSAGNLEICFGESTPELRVTADTGLEIDWYADPIGGIAISTNSEVYTPIDDQVGTYTYYAETRSVPDNCTSSLRTPVSLKINAVPEITNTVLTSEICSGESFSGFELTSDLAGASFSWVATSTDASGFTDNGTGNIPSETLETSVDQGVVTYTVTPSLDGCDGAAVDFVVTVNGLPNVIIDTKECSSDLETYTITYTSDFDVVGDKGTPSTNMISEIPSGESIILTITNSASGCTDEVTITAPQCDCNDVAAPISAGDIEICFEESNIDLTVSTIANTTVNWYNSPISQDILSTGLSITPTEISVGSYSYYAEAVDDITGCISNDRTEVIFTINALPTISIDSKECTDDLANYVIVFTSDATVTASIGSLIGNEITVPANTNTTLMITDATTGCETTLEVEAPNCECSEVAAPVSGGDQEICEGETIPTLSVTVETGNRADWYDVDGILLVGGANTTTFTPSVLAMGVNTYYVEATNPVDNCNSNTRTEVRITQNALPTISIDSKECTSDLANYVIVFTSDATVTASIGSLIGNEITVPANTNTTLTITDATTGCETTLEVEAPNCECSEVAAPVSGGDQEICEGETIPTLSVTVETGNRADWYDVDGILLVGGANTTTFTPSVLAMGVNTYYVEATNPVDNCISNTKTEVRITQNALPTISIDSKECTDDLSNYVIVFTSDATVTASIGSLIGNEITVPANTNTTLTITDATTGCETTLEVVAPNCECSEVAAPVSGGDQEICEGETIPTLSVTVETGNRADWYDVDGILLVGGANTTTFTPSVLAMGVNTYYVEATNPVDNCISNTKTEVRITQNALPTISIDSKECTDDLSNYVIVFASDATVTVSEGSLSGNEITVAANTNTILTITDSTTGCTTTQEVEAPNCECSEVAAPVSGGDQAICEGETIPTLSVTVEAGNRANWYDVGGALLVGGANTTTFTPSVLAIGVNTYYVEATNPVDNCISNTKTEVRITQNALPTISIDSKECTDDLANYVIVFTSDATVTVSEGSLSGNEITVAANTNTILTITDATTGCTTTQEVVAPNCECSEVAAPVSGGDQEICEGETIPTLSVTVEAGNRANWYDVDGILLVGGANTTTFTPSVLAMGVNTYYVEATNPVDDCNSNTKTEVRITQNALPTISIDSKECTDDLSNYVIVFTSDATVTVSEGSLSGNEITVAANTNTILTITDATTGCETTLEVEAPNCECSDVAAPVSGGDQEICEGETIPTLSVTVEAGNRANWYDVGGALLVGGANTTTFTPSVLAMGVNTYYVEATNPVDNCISNTKTEVRITQNALPTISIDSKECTDDLSNYVIVFTSDATVTALVGDLSGNEITVPANTNTTLTITDATTGCETTLEVVAPNCDCSDVAAPVSGGDQEICEGETIPTLSVIVETGNRADWYDAGGTLLVGGENTTTFTPSVIALGVNRYYVEATNPADDCISNTRTEVSITQNSLPTITIDSKECTDDLANYVIVFTSGSTVTASEGSLSGNEITVAANTNTILTITDTTTGCETTLEVEAPNCECSDVAAPVSGGDQEICEGEVIPTLTASTVSGNELNWYTDLLSVTPIVENENTYLSTNGNAGTQIFYVEAVDPLTGCVSDRIMISLVINPVPEITNSNLEQEICTGEVSADMNFTSTVPGTEYSWTASSSTLTGFTTSGSGDIQGSILENSTSSIGSIVYTVVPRAGGCEGVPVEFIITVNPSVDAGSDKSLECFIDAEFAMDASGIGVWSANNAAAQSTIIQNANDPSSRITGFTGSGIYEYIWTSGNCSDIVVLEILDNCPCVIESNYIIDNTQDTYCMSTGNLIITGDEALPLGGNYLWEMSIDGSEFEAAFGVNTEKDYDASNLGSGTYKIRRIYDLITADAECSNESNEVGFLVFSDKKVPGEIIFDPDPVCQGDTMSLMVDNYDPLLTYNWSIMTGNARLVETLDSMSSLIVESAGKISVSVTQSLSGCAEGLESASSTLDIEVYPTPQPQLGVDTVFCELDETYIIYPGDFEEYVWQDGSTTEEFEIEGEGIYSVSVVDTVGCVGKDEIDIKSFCCDFVYPNIFKADSYGPNSEFKILDMYNCAITSKLYIYDRWGNLVHEGEDTFTWDGFYNGRPVEQGVYVFIFEYEAESADREIFKDKISGDITVIR